MASSRNGDSKGTGRAGPQARRQAPEGMVLQQDGLWIATRDVAVRYEDDGAPGLIPAGQRVVLWSWQDVYEVTDDDARRTGAYRVGGRAGGRSFVTAESVPGANGSAYGLSSGYDWVRPDPFRPFRVPDDLAAPPPREWELAPVASKRCLAWCGSTGNVTIRSLDDRRLLSFEVERHELYSVNIAVWSTTHSVEDFCRAEQPTWLDDHLEHADALYIFLGLGERSDAVIDIDLRPRWIERSVLRPEWVAAMRTLERLDRDPEAFQAHMAAERQRILDRARAVMPVMTLNEAMPILTAGGMVQRLRFEVNAHGGDHLDVYAVRSGRDPRTWRVTGDEPKPADIVGMLDTAEGERLADAARQHRCGLVDEAPLRMRQPNQDRQWVRPEDREAESAPRFTARNLIVWTEETPHHHTGTAAFGGTWTLSVYPPGMPGLTCHAARNFGIGVDNLDSPDPGIAERYFFDERGDAAKLLTDARLWALGAEVLHQIGGGWDTQRLPPSAFSIDLLETAARAEMREIGVKDTAARRHRASSNRLIAIAWELRRLGSGLGWRLVGESLAHDLGMVDEDAPLDPDGPE